MTRPTRGFFIIWLFFIFISSLLFGGLGSSIAFSVYLAFSIYFSVFKSRDWINPAFFYGVFLLLSTLANIRIIAIFEAGISLNSYRYARPELFNEATMVWALGNFFILEAYKWKIRWKWPTLEWTLKGNRQMWLLFWLSVALIFRRFWLPFSLPGALNTIINLLPLLGVFIHARMAELKTGKGIFFRAIILVALATSYAVLFSYLRTNMIIPGLVFFLGTLSAKQNIWILKAPRFYLLYAFFAIFMLFFVVFGARRSGLGYGFARITQLQQAKVEFITAADRTQLSAFERASTIGQLSAAVGLVEDYGYYQGQASAPLLVALIPRFLWPEKPKIALGVWFAMEIGAASKTETWYNNSVNMTIPGHLFLDFGWWGLIIGGIFIGRFLRLLWETTQFIHHPLNFTGSLFAVYLLYTSFLGLGADMQILITMLAIYLIVLVLDRGLQHLFPRQQSTNQWKEAMVLTREYFKSS